MILVRIVLALIGVAARMILWPRQWHGTPRGVNQGTPYFLYETKSKKWPERWLGMQLKTPAPFRIHPAEPLDRLRGRLIPSDTLDGPRLYLTSHHPAITTLVAESDALRAAIFEALDCGHELRFDGHFVWLQSSGNPRCVDALDAVRRACAPLEGEHPRKLRYSYVWKTLVVEAVIWAMVGYTAGGIIEWLGTGREHIHLERQPIILGGLLLAGAFFVALLLVAAFWLRGASRGFTSFLLQASFLSVLPVVGMQITSDLNRGLDTSTSIVRDGIADKCVVRHVSKGTVYQMFLKERDKPIPDEVHVVSDICESVNGPTRVRFTIAAGYLGVPWYREIETGTAIWSPH